MRHFLAFAFISILAGCVADGVGTSQQSLNYDPEPQASTVCTCQNINGACKTDCSGIDCNSGFGDCDGKLETGCETSLDDPNNCGACGNNCHDCNDHATCVSQRCAGKAYPDGTLCRAASCTAVGVCARGECSCSDGMDMMTPPLPTVAPGPKQPPGGHDLPGDCSFTGGGTATASLLLLLGAILLLYRRRRA